ncbi:MULTISPECIES: nuclear transport factor 2 family protein [Streptomyces]|uniref:Nuclear transport factor 2 family protein n=1 Tax=Streptomyces yunnanensis TaxID=156453 RepID=A0ABY8A2J0_9ACTN|nr:MULTISPECIES: nuclear transport factor 2 family protein [Streptomyces]AJC52687.1 hypothetical protein GZL_00079 [Streptomyces sp. 769]AJC61852.1 hypothetical protein GZL_09334 [Streptomyces sp. 769]WEB37922.1 nuclear transport factor 2 family protein [Streptomyces yunnanensis]
MATFEPTSDIDKHAELYAQVLNSGDAEALNALYTEDAIAVWEPDQPLTGAARKAALAEFLTMNPVMTAKTRESYVTGDTALLFVDWTMEIDTPDGRRSDSGVGVDVVRRGADGKWRHAVDSPYSGTK